MTFGQNLQKLRERAGLSQSDLARRAGLSLRSLQNWEIDRYLPRIDAAAQLARALGVSLDQLAVFGRRKRRSRT
jgi:transcriptional regulator with XRE-family HTH domain